MHHHPADLGCTVSPVFLCISLPAFRMLCIHLAQLLLLPLAVGVPRLV